MSDENLGPCPFCGEDAKPTVAREAIHKCAIVPLKHRKIGGYAVQIGGVGGGGVPPGALQLIDLWEAFDALRWQVAELERQLETERRIYNLSNPDSDGFGGNPRRNA